MLLKADGIEKDVDIYEIFVHLYEEQPDPYSWWEDYEDVLERFYEDEELDVLEQNPIPVLKACGEYYLQRLTTYFNEGLEEEIQNS